ncbi:hypothetical protein [Microbacterium sp. NPDC076911]
MADPLRVSVLEATVPLVIAIVLCTPVVPLALSTMPSLQYWRTE